MTSRRDYAASLGLAITGARGRLSREANDACDASGLVFDGPVVKVKSPKTVKPVATRVTRATSVPNDDDLDEFNIQDAVYSNSQMWKSTSGQLVNGRAVCSQCGFSLQYHLCKNPSAVVSPGVMEALVRV